jgi:NAD-dependent dihydropyrimidine dehydrogenase PreA subunit
MAQDSKKTVFTLDSERCIGCGICIDACPLKILALVDGLCVMTDAGKCLECGTCIRECPQDAIFIPGVKVSSKTGSDAPRSAAAAPVVPDDQKFTPILQHLTDILTRELKPEQIRDHAGTDILSLHEFDVEGHSCFYRAYKAPKLEKIGLSRMNFYGTMVADVIVVTPAAEYDIPYYIMDWDESDEHIFFICDLMSGDDVGRNQEQLQKYYYEPLEDLYQEFSAMPGMRSSVFHWVRALHSPYIITGTVEKTPENVAGIFKCAVDYFNAWLNIYKAAQPRDPQSPEMRLINQRRRQIRAVYKENDPGVGSLNKFLGDKMADIALSIIEP